MKVAAVAVPEIPRDGQARFTLDDAERAANAWGANCGPAALAAVVGMTLEELRPYLGDFERKGYLSLAMMRASLLNLGIGWRGAVDPWPDRGLLRVQWEGPWTAPGVPFAARARRTHWIGCRRLAVGTDDIEIFDINCMCVGGWVHLEEWRVEVVPWLLRECHPKANGRWHITHQIQVLASRARPLLPGAPGTPCG